MIFEDDADFQVGDRVWLNREQKSMGVDLQVYPARGRLERLDHDAYHWIVKLDQRGTYTRPTGETEWLPEIRMAPDNLYPVLPKAYRYRLGWYPVRFIPVAMIVVGLGMFLAVVAPSWAWLWFFLVWMGVNLMLAFSVPKEVRGGGSGG